MAQNSKVLLVTDVPPCRQYSGSLLTWHLCKTFTAQTLAGYFLVHPELHAVPEFPFSPAPEFVNLSKGYEASYRPRYLPGPIKMLCSYVREMYRKHVEVPRHTRHILAFAKKNQVDKIWIILQGQTMIWIAERLIRKGILPVHAQVWDSAKWWARANSFDRFSKRNLIKSYEYCIAHADEFGSPSFNMSKLVKEKYRRESYPLIGVSPAAPRSDASADRTSKDKYIIGIAGQLYANGPLEALCHSLDSTYWQIDGRQVEIHYWGYTPVPVKRSRIISRGYVSQEKLLDELATCHVLYCPYWFDYSFDEESQTSFPSKIVSYLNSGRPVFFHGKANSSPGLLLSQKNAAICCFSQDVENILFHLRKALFSPEVASILENAARLAGAELSTEYSAQSFRKFMKLEDSIQVGKKAPDYGRPVEL